MALMISFWNPSAQGPHTRFQPNISSVFLCVFPCADVCTLMCVTCMWKPENKLGCFLPPPPFSDKASHWLGTHPVHTSPSTDQKTSLHLALEIKLWFLASQVLYLVSYVLAPAFLIWTQPFLFFHDLHPSFLGSTVVALDFGESY